MAANVVLLIVSATGLVCEVLNKTLRLPARGSRNRRLYIQLENAVADFNDGAIERDEFRRTIDEVSREYAEEDTQ